MFEQVAQERNVAQQRNLRDVTEFCVWITPPMTTVPPSVTSTCVVACCVISVGLPVNRYTAEVRASCFPRPRSGRWCFPT